MIEVPGVDTDVYLIQWAHWWCITEKLMLGARPGPDRAFAIHVHETAKRNLRQSVFLANRAAEKAKPQEAGHG